MLLRRPVPLIQPHAIRLPKTSSAQSDDNTTRPLQLSRRLWRSAQTTSARMRTGLPADTTVVHVSSTTRLAHTAQVVGSRWSTCAATAVLQWVRRLSAEAAELKSTPFRSAKYVDPG